MGLIAPTRLAEKDIEEFEVDGIRMVFQNTPDTSLVNRLFVVSARAGTQGSKSSNGSLDPRFRGATINH